MIAHRALPLALLMLLTTSCALLASPGLPPPGSESARWLARGHDDVVTMDVELHDGTRDRELATRLWWPAGATGPLPLVVQSHGFLGNRNGGAYLARALARRGYVVAAATHPTTTLFARGGARVEDVSEQPADLSFLIDRLLDDHLGGPPRPAIDPTRIAVTGHSLGGLTATLAAFHPRLHDARIGAAVSIAGPLAMFEPRFFASVPVPLLMVAGSYDVIVDYRTHALATFGRVPDETLVLIAGASHTGFDDAMTGLPRLLDNPDTMSCWVLARSIDLTGARAELEELARAGDGVEPGYRIEPPCRDVPPPVAMDTARQQVLTTLAVTAFLDSRFAPDPLVRADALSYLTGGLARENPEVSVIDSRPQTADRRPARADARLHADALGGHTGKVDGEAASGTRWTHRVCVRRSCRGSIPRRPSQARDSTCSRVWTFRVRLDGAFDRAARCVAVYGREAARAGCAAVGSGHLVEPRRRPACFIRDARNGHARRGGRRR